MLSDEFGKGDLSPTARDLVTKYLASTAGQKKRGDDKLNQARGLGIKYLASTAGQEKRGDEKLNQARDLVAKIRTFVAENDLRFIEDKMT